MFVLFSALYARCPYYVLLYMHMQGVRIIYCFVLTASQVCRTYTGAQLLQAQATTAGAAPSGSCVLGLARRFVVKHCFRVPSSGQQVVFNRAAVYLHAAHTIVLREVWTDWLPTETPSARSGSSA